MPFINGNKKANGLLAGFLVYKVKACQFDALREFLKREST